MGLIGANEILKNAQRRAGADKDVVFDETTKKYVFKADLQKARAQGSTIKPSTATSSTTKVTVDSKKPEAKPSSTKKIGYICLKCKYKFSRAPEMTVNKCPYCAHPKLEVVDNKNADRVIGESDAYDY